LSLICIGLVLIGQILKCFLAFNSPVSKDLSGRTLWWICSMVNNTVVFPLQNACSAVLILGNTQAKGSGSVVLLDSVVGVGSTLLASAQLLNFHCKLS
jgi:hypothetical protein